MFELVPTGTKIDFLGKRHIAIFFSLCLVALAFYKWVSMGESKYGVDYRGGTEMVVRIKEAIDPQVLRDALQKGGIENAVVQSFEIGSHEYSIRLSGEGVKGQVEAALKAAIQDKFEVLQTDVVGPTMGEELRRKALIAICIGLLALLAYVAFRFEFAFALGAVVAVFHDVIVATGLYLAFGGEINASTLAGALTIVGYSINDTIVIFDRVREEILRGHKHKDLVALFNHCMNSMLGRTIITNLLTFFSALALLIFGGGAIQDLSLYLVFGLIAGTYSTIFIASPVVLAWEGWAAKREKAKQAVAA